jgi:CBS domain-containing protein/ribosomal protein S18 acetylase RimI-like enzyme
MDSISITESRPSPILATLHASAGAERDYLFATRSAQPDDLILVAWKGTEAVAYIAASDEGACGLLIWEHLVLPHHRNQGIGERLLHEAARRIRPGVTMVIDPMAELDPTRTTHYYRRLGFRRQSPGTELWATGADVLRAARRRGQRSEYETPIRTIVDGKAPGVVTVDPSATVSHAISLMNHRRIGALVVSSDGRRVEGILSERDVLVGLDEMGAGFLHRPVSSVCTTDVVTSTLTDSVAAVMDLMTNRRIRHMPITAQGDLVGIVSVGDFVLHRLYSLDLADPATIDPLIASG